MKKILTPGLKKFVVKCNRCLCEFEYELSDTYKMITTEYVKCPECNQELLHLPCSNTKRSRDNECTSR